MITIRWCLTLLLLAFTFFARADQVEMLNGDRYVGAVMTMSADTVFLQSDVLGQIKIPRGKFRRLLWEKHRYVQLIPPTSVPAPATTDASGPLAQLAAHTNLVDGIKKQFLGDAGPGSEREV